ncbi:hypothetical protein ACFLRA_03125 [Bdellovibrionota bacterium]
MAAHFIYTGGFLLPAIRVAGQRIDSLHDFLNIPAFTSHPIFQLFAVVAALVFLFWGLFILFGKKRTSIAIGRPAIWIWVGLCLIVFSQVLEIAVEGYFIIERPTLYWFRYPEEFVEMLGGISFFISMLEASFIISAKRFKPIATPLPQEPSCQPAG